MQKYVNCESNSLGSDTRGRLTLRESDLEEILKIRITPRNFYQNPSIGEKKWSSKTSSTDPLIKSAETSSFRITHNDCTMYTNDAIA